MTLPAASLTASELPAGVALQPATVTAVRPDALEVRLALSGGSPVRARLALPVPYEAREGDEVLVIGDARGHYVIGVLAGRGRTVLAFPGDVDVRAVGGELRLAGDRAVRVESPEVEVRTGKLSSFAETVFQRVTALHQRVTDLLSVHAGQSRSVVEGSAYAQAKSATLLTEDTVTVNGKAIHLG